MVAWSAHDIGKGAIFHSFDHLVWKNHDSYENPVLIYFSVELAHLLPCLSKNVFGIGKSTAQDWTNPFLENSRSRGGRFALRTRLSGKACPGHASRATTLKNAAIAHAKHGNGGHRRPAVDFIDSLIGLSCRKAVGKTDFFEEKLAHKAHAELISKGSSL